MTSNKTNRSISPSSTTTNKKECNIQVAVRLRGKSNEEINQNVQQIIHTDQLLGSKVLVQNGNNNEKTYHFDKVFGPKASQIVVFKDLICPMISEVLTGYNCTVFAYGQTGTGKTYTMTGKAESNCSAISLHAGIIPRTIHRIFDLLENSTNKEEFLLKISFIEIYNEELKDLLNEANNGEDNSKRLRIYEDVSKKGSVVVNNVDEVIIKNANEGIEWLNKGLQKRIVAQTKYNQHSSRSHSIFTITVHIKETNAGIELLKTGKFNLVDLAGSENIGRSGAENQRKREAGMINQSLLTLGRVINSLVDYCPHVPYRESKLTRLLQDSLGGKTKTCIIATISPSKLNIEETMSTLEYANRAKNIRNKPEINQKMAKKELIKEYTNQIDNLKLELEATREKNGVYMTHDQYKAINTENAYLKESIRLANKHNDELQHEINETSNKLSSQITKNNELTEELKNTKTMLEHNKAQLRDLISKYKNCKLQFYQQSFLTKEYQNSESEMDKLANEFVLVIDKYFQEIEILHSEIEKTKTIGEENSTIVNESYSKLDDFTEHIKITYNNIKSIITEQNETIKQKVLTKTKEEIIKTNNHHHKMLEETIKQINKINDNLKVFNREEADFISDNQRTIDALKAKILEEKEKNNEDMNNIVSEIIKQNEQCVLDFRKKIDEQKEDFKLFVSNSRSDFMGIVRKHEAATQLHNSTITTALINKVEAHEANNTKLNTELQEANKNVESIKANLQTELENLILNAFNHTTTKFNCILEKHKMAQKLHKNSILSTVRDAEEYETQSHSLNKEHETFINDNMNKAYSAVESWHKTVGDYNDLVIIKSKENTNQMHSFYKETNFADEKNTKQRNIIDNQTTSKIMQDKLHEHMLLEEMHQKVDGIKAETDKQLKSNINLITERTRETIGRIDSFKEVTVKDLDTSINKDFISQAHSIKKVLSAYKKNENKINLRREHKHRREWELVNEELAIKKFKQQYNIKDDEQPVIRKRKPEELDPTSLESNTLAESNKTNKLQNGSL